MEKLKKNVMNRYSAPEIEVVNVEIGQTVLAGGSGDGNLQDMTGEYW